MPALGLISTLSSGHLSWLFQQLFLISSWHRNSIINNPHKLWRQPQMYSPFSEDIQSQHLLLSTSFAEFECKASFCILVALKRGGIAFSSAWSWHKPSWPRLCCHLELSSGDLGMRPPEPGNSWGTLRNLHCLPLAALVLQLQMETAWLRLSWDMF